MKHLLLGAALALAVCSPTLAADKACQLKQSASLDMNTEPNGTVSVPAMVDNLPVLMLVDTGSVFSSISGDIADQLELRRNTAYFPMQLAGGIPFNEQAQVQKFSLGELTARQFRFYVAPRDIMAGNYMGLLGPDIMNNYDVEFDFAAAKFNIFSQAHCPGQVVYWTRQPYAEVPITVMSDWHITAPVQVEGHMLDAIVDTGAERSLMTMDTARQVLGIDERNPLLKKMEMISLNGAKRTNAYKYPFAPLTLGSITIRNPDIVIIEDAGIGDSMPPLLLGANVLRQLHMYIAYREQKLYLTDAEAR